jgi:hypothetical protein
MIYVQKLQLLKAQYDEAFGLLANARQTATDTQQKMAEG